MRIYQEQQVSALCHLFNAIPLWGLLVCGYLWFSLREESRSVVRHARQAMAFHALMMAGGVVWVLLGLTARVFGALSPALGSLTRGVNNLMFMVIFVLYVAICLWGAWRCLAGLPFNYPLVGPRG